MGEPGKLYRPRTFMAALARSRILLLTVVALLAWPAVISAAVTVSASLSEALYSAESNTDCASLHTLKDQGTAGGQGELPMNIVRLHATVPGVPDDKVTFRWSVLKPEFGMLVADQNIAGGESQPVIEGICAKFGTEGGPCVLSGDRLRLYALPSILWVAPTCDILPKNTAKQFRGGLARFKVKALMGKQKLGKGRVSVGFGRVASIILFADEQNGLGKPSGVAGGVRFIFSSDTNPNGQSLPPLDHYEFTNGAGATADSEGSCVFEDGRRFDACAGASGELDYHAVGRFLAAVKEVFADHSALCDNITVQVLACAPRGEVEVIRRPRVRAYTPGNPRTGKVDVTVRLRNRSVAERGLPPCGFLLDENVLSCAEEAVFAGGSATKSTQFTLEQLGIPSDFVLRPGRSIDLLILDNVPLINVLPDTATLTDIWTAQTVNAGGFDATDKYRIKGRPGVTAPAP